MENISHIQSIPIKSPADPMLPGLTYHLLIENPNEGVRSPVLTVLIPKAPSELRVGSNINDEMVSPLPPICIEYISHSFEVVDFRPAIASVPVGHYLVKASFLATSTIHFPHFSIGQRAKKARNWPQVPSVPLRHPAIVPLEFVCPIYPGTRNSISKQSPN